MEQSFLTVAHLWSISSFTSLTCSELACVSIWLWFGLCFNLLMKKRIGKKKKKILGTAELILDLIRNVACGLWARWVEKLVGMIVIFAWGKIPCWIRGEWFLDSWKMNSHVLVVFPVSIERWSRGLTYGMESACANFALLSRAVDEWSWLELHFAQAWL